MYPSMHLVRGGVWCRGCLPREGCGRADTLPPPEMATAAVATQATGMHTCYDICLDGGEKPLSEYSDSEMDGYELPSKGLG